MTAPRRVSSVVVHIEELVLHGFERRDRHAIADAISAELTRVLADSGVPDAWTGAAAGAAAEHVDASCELPARAAPVTIGTRVATALYEGLDAWPRER